MTQEEHKQGGPASLSVVISPSSSSEDDTLLESANSRPPSSTEDKEQAKETTVETVTEKRKKQLLTILQAYSEQSSKLLCGFWESAIVDFPQDISNELYQLYPIRRSILTTVPPTRELLGICKTNSTPQEPYLYFVNGRFFYYVNDKIHHLTLDTSFSETSKKDELKKAIIDKCHLYQIKLPKTGALVCAAIFDVLSQKTEITDEIYINLLFKIFGFLSKKLDATNQIGLTGAFNQWLIKTFVMPELIKLAVEPSLSLPTMQSTAKSTPPSSSSNSSRFQTTEKTNSHEPYQKTLLTPPNRRRKKLLDILQLYWDQTFKLNSSHTIVAFPISIIEEMETTDPMLHHHKLPRSGKEVCSAIFEVLQNSKGKNIDDETYKKLLEKIHDILSPKLEKNSLFGRIVGRDPSTVDFNRKCIKKISSDLMCLHEIDAKLLKISTLAVEQKWRKGKFNCF